MALRITLFVVIGYIAVCIKATRVPREQHKVVPTEAHKKAGSASAPTALLGLQTAAEEPGKVSKGNVTVLTPAFLAAPELYPPVTPTSALVGPVLAQGPAYANPKQNNQTNNAKLQGEEQLQDQSPPTVETNPSLSASRFLPGKQGGHSRANMDGSYVMYQDIPAEVRADLQLVEEQAAREKDSSFTGVLRQILADIGGGTGATVGGNRKLSD